MGRPGPGGPCPASAAAPAVLVVGVGLISATQAVFYVEGRHRLAVEPLLLVLAVELVVPARRQSAAYDEGCHAFAGHSYWNRGDFGVNPEHPPAVKLLAMFPLGRSLQFPPRKNVQFKNECFVGASPSCIPIP